MLGTIKYIVAYNYYPSDREQVFDQGGSYEEPNGHYIFEKPYALWNFGRGLSYTDFEYTDVHLSDTVFSGQGKLSVTLKVKIPVGETERKSYNYMYVINSVRWSCPFSN